MRVTAPRRSLDDPTVTSVSLFRGDDDFDGHRPTIADMKGLSLRGNGEANYRDGQRCRQTPFHCGPPQQAVIIHRARIRNVNSLRPECRAAIRYLYWCLERVSAVMHSACAQTLRANWEQTEGFGV